MLFINLVLNYLDKKYGVPILFFFLPLSNIWPEVQATVTYSEINTLARELAFLVMWLSRPTSFRT